MDTHIKQVAEVLRMYVDTVRNLQFKSEKMPVLKNMYRYILEETEFIMSATRFREVLLKKTEEFLYDIDNIDDNEFKSLASQVLNKYKFTYEEDDGIDDDHEIEEEHYDHSGEI
jgi:hypothetical protein